MVTDATGRRLGDLGNAVGNVPEHINKAGLVIAEVLERELSSAEWTDERIREVADQVWQRARGQVDLHNDAVKQRRQREQARERLEALPEEDQILLARGVPLKGDGTDPRERAWRRAAAAEAVASDGQVWLVAKNDHWTGGRDLPLPSELEALRQKAAQASRESAQKEGEQR